MNQDESELLLRYITTVYFTNKTHFKISFREARSNVSETEASVETSESLQKVLSDTQLGIRQALCWREPLQHPGGQRLRREHYWRRREPLHRA